MVIPSIYEFFLDKYFLECMDVFEARKSVSSFKKIPSANDIKKAIKNRNYVGIYYHEPTEEGKILEGFRLVEPYCYGRGYVTPQTGKVSHENRQYLRVFVIRDTKHDPTFKDKKQFTRRKSVSRSRRVPYWRLMRVDRIVDWQTIPRVFSTYRELYNPDDEMIDRVIASLDITKFPQGRSKVRR